jgi:hypothetical protein
MIEDSVGNCTVGLADVMLDGDGCLFPVCAVQSPTRIG